MRRAIWASSAAVRWSMSAFSPRSVATAEWLCASADATEGDMAPGPGAGAAGLGLAKEEEEEVEARAFEVEADEVGGAAAVGGEGAKRANGFSSGFDVGVGTNGMSAVDDDDDAAALDVWGGGIEYAAALEPAPEPGWLNRALKADESPVLRTRAPNASGVRPYWAAWSTPAPGAVVVGVGSADELAGEGMAVKRCCDGERARVPMLAVGAEAMRAVAGRRDSMSGTRRERGRGKVREGKREGEVRTARDSRQPVVLVAPEQRDLLDLVVAAVELAQGGALLLLLLPALDVLEEEPALGHDDDAVLALALALGASSSSSRARARARRAEAEPERVVGRRRRAVGRAGVVLDLGRGRRGAAVLLLLALVEDVAAKDAGEEPEDLVDRLLLLLVLLAALDGLLPQGVVARLELLEVGADGRLVLADRGEVGDERREVERAVGAGRGHDGAVRLDLAVDHAQQVGLAALEVGVAELDCGRAFSSQLRGRERRRDKLEREREGTHACRRPPSCRA